MCLKAVYFLMCDDVMLKSLELELMIFEFKFSVSYNVPEYVCTGQSLST